MTTIKLKNGSGAPTAGDLAQGEPALDLTNKRLYTEDSGGTVIEVGTNPGVDVTFADNRKAVFGTGSDLEIYHDGSHSYVKDSGTGHLKLQGTDVRIQSADGSENFLVADLDGAVRIYNDNTQRLQTTTTGINVTGNATFDDNGKAIFGAGSDLQIYHDGSNSIINDSGTGDLRIGGSTNVQIWNSATSKLSGNFNGDGAATLYNNGGAKLATTSTGIDVTGTVTADGLTVDGIAEISSTTPTLRFFETDQTDEGTLLRSAGDSFQIAKMLDTGAADGIRFAIDQSSGDISFYEDTGTTAKLFWDASAESLGIGTSTVNRALEIAGNNNGGAKANYIRITDTDTSATASNQQGGIEFYTSDSGNANVTASIENLYSGSGAGSNLTFNTAPNGASGVSEAMRIDSSGNLLVSKSSLDVGTVGLELRADGLLAATRSGSNVAVFRRLSDDGSIVDFQKDGSTVGSIKADAGSIGVGSGNVGVLFYDAGDRIIPRNGTSTSDDVIDLGFSTDRFKDIYATNGTIQTSDRNEKQDIEELSDAEQRVAVACKGLLRKFRFKSSVEEKGDDARIHFGIIAQDLQDAFTAEGLDAGRYGMFINSTWTDEETGEERSRMGVRYSELLAFIISAI